MRLLNSPPIPRGWPSVLALVVGLILASRLLLAVVAEGSALVIEKGRFEPPPGSVWYDKWRRWDADWYLQIVSDGYFYKPDAESSVAFFPLYPALIACAAPVFGNAVVAGMVLSNAFLIGTALIAFALAGEARLGGDATGRWAVALLCFGPVSFFFSVVYSESCFLFLSSGSMLAAVRRRWLLAGACGYLAALSRNAGALLAAPLLVEFIAARKESGTAWWKAWPCLLPLAGLATWMAYLGQRFGDPLIVMKIQAAWDRKLSWPWEGFARQNFKYPPFYQWWFAGAAASGLALLIAGIAMRMRDSLLVLCALLFLLVTSSGRMEALPRYLSTNFPLYLIAGGLCARSPTAGIAWVAFSAGLLALSAVLFVNGYWFT